MNVSTPSYPAQVRSAIRVSILTSLLLAALKCAAGSLTHSMAILASALDSLMDAGSSIVNYIAAKEASKPPDEGHDYGHGKIESLAGLFQSQFILLSGLFLVFESSKRLVQGQVLVHTGAGIAVMAVSFLATAALVAYLRKVSERGHSMVMRAEKVHFASDVLATLGVIAALVLSHVTKMPVWDLVLSIGIALWIFRGAAGLLRQSIDELLDRSLPLATREKIREVILGYDRRIAGLHEFRSHRVGEKIFLDFHLEISGENDFSKAHGITEGLIRKIQELYPGADVTIHYDPQGET